MMETLDNSLEMSFKRSPSKVWWGSESLEFREVSSSPGSQDSGFSDSETSGKERKTQQKEETIPEENNNEAATPTKILNNSKQIAKNIFKISVNNCDTNNLASNYKEKCTPNKENIDQRLVKSERKDSPHFLKKFCTIEAPLTEPSKRQSRSLKHSPKVSRNLFAVTKNTKECLGAAPNQYSNLIERPNEEEPNEKENSSCYDSTASEISGTKSVPLFKTSPQVITQRATRSAPNFEEFEAVTSFNSTSSECESELEQIFEDLEHTSTPKSFGGMTNGRNKKLQERLRLRYQDQERVPPIHTDGITVDNKAVMRWLEEARLSIEQECTTMLQCKSIAAELSQRVSHLAACGTTILRGLLSHSRCIEMDYKNLNSDSKHISPLVQSLAGNILDFLKTHTSQVSSQNLRLYDQIRSSTSAENARKPLAELFSEWESIQREILVKEIKKLVDKLEDPTSEIDLRATLTGITSVALRNGDLIEHFVKVHHYWGSVKLYLIMPP
ncbi:unnamed protein product [Ceutorhynchus assimilis]|uniref:Uncharacterized protein n=1 Tax=Ceutorhynchus assimilis TaxID=467358 RepID=A0A9N9MP67_9CUCU|nr:unnamed protein product [Ceutorhynchus assimilis]